ncbi:MAG TPA: putative DNA modification/repair radical SAM protein [Sphingomicrobium sp.]|nr:putative DNA modification/repair radical SAM protein [Sphingomicrobium sp.]
MSRLDLKAKLAILADAAKYDASCASSGTTTRDSLGGKGVGSSEGMGICHAYAPDGRCISLLKILLTNSCIFDCAYCINRKSSKVRRARFSIDEIVQLTIAFYKRNYVEGLFLSSGIIRSSNYTMEQIVEVARTLREDHDFRGYIHLKTIPDADPELVHLAGLHADRISINVELPTERALHELAPEKDLGRIEGAMGTMKSSIAAAEDGAKRFKCAPRFAPAGQSTQMIIGADRANDRDIVANASKLYERFALRRVYYSAFSPIPDASCILPLKRPPLMREHRIYQADWLMRFYGFTLSDVQDTTDENGMLSLEIDPKLSWALKYRESFPVDVNRASREMLLRVPGLGSKAVERIVASRRWRKLALGDVAPLTSSIAKVRPFISATDWRPSLLLDRSDLRSLVAPKQQQLELFAN